MNPVEILEAARERIDHPAKFWRGLEPDPIYFHGLADFEARECVCLGLAVSRPAVGHTHTPENLEARKIVQGIVGLRKVDEDWTEIFKWNDAHSWEDAIDALDRAIEKAHAER